MRTLLFAVVLLLASTAVLAQTRTPPATPPRFTLASASASGDPHFTSFDGRFHDAQIQGMFTYLKNDIVHIQALSQRGCGAALVTCIRAVYVQLQPMFSEERLFFSWGSWTNNKVDNIVIQEFIPGQPFINNSYTTATFSRTFPPSAPRSVLNRKYNLVFTSNQLRLIPSATSAADPALAISITIGTYYLAVTLPKAEPHMFKTNGLLGYFDGSPNSDFLFMNGTKTVVPNTPSRVNSPQVNAWAASFAVSNSNPALTQSYPHPEHHTLMDINAHPVLSSVPSDQEQDQIMVVNFKTLDEANTVNNHCKNILANVNNAPLADGATADTTVAFENCLMDGAGDLQVATSVAESIRAAAEMQAAGQPSDSGLPQGALIAIIAVACVCGISLIVIVGLFIHNRRLKSQVDQYAIIVHSNPSNVGPVNVGEIQL